jgi:molybdopterin synthase catalytic subunit
MTTVNDQPATQNTITITMRYFAILRQSLGRSAEERTVSAGTTVRQLADDILTDLGGARLAALRASTMVMVNEEYADDDYILRDGDEVALIPPVSGGQDARDDDRRFHVGPEPLDPRAVEALVAAPDAGAIVTFIGTVRDNARGQPVSALVYEAYERPAEKQLAAIADEVLERWHIPRERVAVHHRTGRLVPGEASVVISVASSHRDEAFEACRHIIERIKQIVPIWKEEHYAGGAVWVGSEAAYQDLPDRKAPMTAAAL